MLQRIQSVFMFLVVVTGTLIFFFPIASYISDTSYLKFFIHIVNNISHNPFDEMASPALSFQDWFTLPLSIGQLIIIILVFVSIFKYGNRPTQVWINSLNIFLNILLVGGIFYYSTLIENKSGVIPQYDIGGVFPLISIILLFVANFYIRKDEKLVRSADRLR